MALWLESQSETSLAKSKASRLSQESLSSLEEMFAELLALMLASRWAEQLAMQWVLDSCWIHLWLEMLRSPLRWVFEMAYNLACVLEVYRTGATLEPQWEYESAQLLVTQWVSGLEEQSANPWDAGL